MTNPVSQKVAIGQYEDDKVLKINSDGSIDVVVSGGGGGGTSSDFGSAFPTAGTAAGFTDGTNMQPARVDSGGNQTVVGSSASGATDDGTAPVKVGGKYNSTLPTYTDGQRAGAQFDANGRLIGNVVGNVASGAADSGNPVKIGAVYNTAFPVVADGNRVNVQAGIRGGIIVSGGDTTAGADTLSNAGIVGLTAHDSASFRLLAASPWVFNGTTWDRLRGDTNGLKVTNSQNNIGNVGGKTVSVTVTPTVTASNAYGINYVVGGLLTFANAFTSTGSGIIQSVTVTIAKVETSGFTFYPFNANPSNTTWTDAAVAAINAADVAKVRPPITLSQASQLGTHTVASATGLGEAISPGATSLYGVLIANAALTNQFGSTSDVTVTVTILQDL